MYYFLPYFKGIAPLLLPFALVGFLLKNKQTLLYLERLELN